MKDLENKSRIAPALFIFIPYCKTICTYCDFNVYARRDKLFEAYADALSKEVALVALDSPMPRRAKSLALGGGTPSILPAALLTKIFEAVY